jgi:DNA repair exonuclease SbcCD nuclease subunit
MKIIHAADLHIDSPFQGHVNGLGVLGEQSHLATRRAYHNLIELCLQQEAEVLLLAGDIFDGDCCDTATGEFFLAGLDRLQEVGTRVVLVYGNHDAECRVTRRLRLPDHVHRLATDRPETLVIEHLGVAVHGQSYARTAVWDNLARDYPPPLPDLLNIGLLHTNAIGYAHDPLYAPCTVEELVAKDYAYWALGHLHWSQVLHENPWVVYPGNLQARYMQEAGPKGCALIDSQEQEIRSVEHRLLDVVRWTQVYVQVHPGDYPDEVVGSVCAALQLAREEAQGRPVVAEVVIEHTLTGHNTWPADYRIWECGVHEVVGDMEQLCIENVLIKESVSRATSCG